jgi:hypothetical protein
VCSRKKLQDEAEDDNAEDGILLSEAGSQYSEFAPTRDFSPRVKQRNDATPLPAAQGSVCTRHRCY